MKNKSSIINYQLAIIIAVLAIMTSCGVYKKYTPQTDAPDNLFGEVVSDSSSIAELSWREFFTDPLLQQLIDSALARNTDIQSARLTVEKAQASLRAAKLAWLSEYLECQGCRK